MSHKPSQADLILTDMLAGRDMTHSRAAEIANCYVLRNRIGDLMKRGYNIKRVKIEQTGRKPFHVYRLVGQLDLIP